MRCQDVGLHDPGRSEHRGGDAVITDRENLDDVLLFHGFPETVAPFVTTSVEARGCGYRRSGRASIIDDDAPIVLMVKQEVTRLVERRCKLSGLPGNTPSPRACVLVT